MKEDKNKALRPAISARPDGFFALLLCAISMGATLIATVIDKFIFPFGKELLSPIIAQILVLLIPAYIFMLLATSQKTTIDRMRDIGIKRLRAEYIFFLIFASFFTITTSFLINMIFGGVHSAAQGFTLLGAFRAGEQEFTVSPLYLIVSYALIPSFAEEFVFRGVIFKSLRQVGLPFSALLSSVIYSLFFFSPAQIPEVIFCGLMFSFVLMTTDSLIACMALHFAVNLYRLFLQTNLSQYLLYSQNSLLLITITVLAWLLSAALFSSESARIYRARAAESKGRDSFGENFFKLSNLWQNIRSVFSYRPTVITSVVCAVIYISITVIGAL